jgi:hypothetical protein
VTNDAIHLPWKPDSSPNWRRDIFDIDSVPTGKEVTGDLYQRAKLIAAAPDCSRTSVVAHSMMRALGREVLRSAQDAIERRRIVLDMSTSTYMMSMSAEASGAQQPAKKLLPASPVTWVVVKLPVRVTGTFWRMKMASQVLDSLNDQMVISSWHISIRNGMKPADMALADMRILEANDIYRADGQFPGRLCSQDSQP